MNADEKTDSTGEQREQLLLCDNCSPAVMPWLLTSGDAMAVMLPSGDAYVYCSYHHSRGALRACVPPHLLGILLGAEILRSGT